mmetsp:Transcript_5782/g.13034  ORF Transcript_5782/g.13034 Transcript_5782/m.13034 type:complete len:81 (-) Transcript_5782:752-994(-)
MTWCSVLQFKQTWFWLVSAFLFSFFFCRDLQTQAKKTQLVYTSFLLSRRGVAESLAAAAAGTAATEDVGNVDVGSALRCL